MNFLYDDSLRAQIERRYGLTISDTTEPIRAIESDARRVGRPIAFTIGFAAGLHAMVGGEWMLRGLTFVRADSSAVRVGPGLPLVDTLAAREFVRDFGEPALPPPGAIDGTARSWMIVVGCPAGYLKAARRGVPADSLDSHCKF
jgi:hypothetical protein